MVHPVQNLRMLIVHIHLVVLLHTQPRQKEIKVFGKKQILYKTLVAWIYHTITRSPLLPTAVHILKF